MINGPAAGVGLVLACYCDLRFAAAGVKLTTSHGRLGLPAEYGLSWLLPRLVGITRATDILLSSRVVLTEEAAAIGLVNRTVPRDELAGCTYDYARQLANEVAPTSLAVTKLQLYRDLHGDVVSSVHNAAARMEEMIRGAEFVEGVAALTEKRSPRFPIRPERGVASNLGVRRWSAVDAGRQLARVPAQEGHGLAEGEAVGHAGHVRHGGPDGLGAARHDIVVQPAGWRRRSR